MGKELEFKLAVPSHALLETILFDKEIANVRQGNYQLFDMATIYYDTADRALSARKWTLRLRQENVRLERGVILPCMALGLAAFIMQSSESLLSVCFNTSFRQSVRSGAAMLSRRFR